MNLGGMPAVGTGSVDLNHGLQPGENKTPDGRLLGFILFG
jgi:hypothetical protein